MCFFHKDQNQRAFKKRVQQVRNNFTLQDAEDVFQLFQQIKTPTLWDKAIMYNFLDRIEELPEIIRYKQQHPYWETTPFHLIRRHVHSKQQPAQIEPLR